MVHSSVLLVLCAFYPVWLLAGWLDYRDHRRKETAPPHGAREAALHLAMLVQVGIGLAATLAYLPSYVLLLVLLVLAMAYLVTTSLTPRWVDGRRRTGVLARLQNTLFEALPLLALALFTAARTWPKTARVFVVIQIAIDVIVWQFPKMLWCNA
jgi:hypothetical protein